MQEDYVVGVDLDGATGPRYVVARNAIGAGRTSIARSSVATSACRSVWLRTAPFFSEK